MGKGISKRAKKQILNILFLALLVGITFAILITSNRELSFRNIKNFLLSCNPWLIAAAFVCMLLFIAFEGGSLLLITRRLGYKSGFLSSMAYSSADIYYSAITPSASGGQPASAYYMVKDGIDAGATTFALVFNLIAYTAAVLVISAAAFILRPKMFSEFEPFVKFLVVAGLVVQTLLLAFFIACTRCHKAVLKCGNGLISLLARMKIVKNVEKWRGKLAEEVEKYRGSLGEIRKHRALFFQVLLLNIAQRVSQTLITCFVCTAAGSGAPFAELFAMQAFVLIGYNSVPLPGGVGAFEYLYLHIYGLRFESAFILSAMMVTRVISYYICILVSGAFTLTEHLIVMKREKTKEIQRGKLENEGNDRQGNERQGERQE